MIIEDRDDNLSNLFSLYQEIGRRFSGSSLFEFDEFKIVRTPDSEWPNIAFYLDEGTISDFVISKMEREMRKLGMHPFVIAKNNGSNFFKFKNQRFSPVEIWSGMYLDKFGEFEISCADKHFQLLELEEEDIRNWTTLISEVLFKAKFLDFGIFEKLRQEGAKLIGLKVDNILIGTSMIYNDSYGNAGLYMVSIKDAYQGRGFGRKLVSYSIYQIRKEGKKYCFLQSTKRAISIYESLRFKKTGDYLLYWKL